MGIKHSVTVVHGQKGLASEWNADHVVDSAVECGQYQFNELILDNLGAFPGGPVEGQIIHRSDLHTTHVYNGNFWPGLQGAATVTVAADSTGMYDDIQDAIDALPAGGGVVYVKEGTYTILATLTRNINRVAIIGTGYATIISTAGNFPIFTLGAGSNWLLANLRLSGAGAGNAGNHGIHFDHGHYNRIVNVEIANMGGDAMYFEDSERNYVEALRIASIIGNGITLLRSDTNIISIIDVLNLGAGSNGIEIDTSDRNKLNKIRIAGADEGVFFTGACLYNVINEIECQGNARNGIVLTNGADYNIIQSCQLIGNTLRGISLEAGADRNIVVGNVAITNVVAQITDAGANNEVDHNQVL